MAKSPISLLRIKREVGLPLTRLLHTVRESLDHRLVLLDHRGETRSCPQAIVGLIRKALARIVMQVVEIVVGLLGFGAQLQLVLAHRLKFVLVVVEDIVASGLFLT